MAYVTLFGWSFLAATVIPVGSEPMLIYLVRQGLPLPGLILVATAGNYLGACTTYGIARGAVALWTGREPSGGRASRRATDLVARYGSVALLLSWVPLVGDAIVAAAGVARVPFPWFSLWTIVGKLARYVAVAFGAAASS